MYTLIVYVYTVASVMYGGRGISTPLANKIKDTYGEILLSKHFFLEIHKVR